MRRLARKNKARERGAMGKRKDGLETLSGRGNKGGTTRKNGGGRVEDREEPGTVAFGQTWLMD